MEIVTFVELIGKIKGTEETDLHIDRLIDYIYGIMRQYPESDSRSMVHGYQNHNMGDHLNDPELKFLMDFIYDQFEEYLRAHGPTKKYYWAINNLWPNVTPPGGFNRLHQHSGCQFSGIFYLQGAPEAGELLLYNPMNTSNLVLNYTDVCPRQSLSHSVYPIRNTGAFFSSSLAHRVDINNSSSDRISISFNIAISEFLPASQ